jgi:hypothetical protein
MDQHARPSESIREAALHKSIAKAEILLDEGRRLRSEIVELLAEIVEQRVRLRTNALGRHGPLATIAPGEPFPVPLKRIPQRPQ